jgi:hypothetical protein
MSFDGKASPKPILIQNEAEFDPKRVDRFGNKFKYLEQHISFKDQIMEAPLESVIEYDQVEVDIENSSCSEAEKHSKEKGRKRSKSSATGSTDSSHSKSKAKKKGCSCSIF